MIIDIIDAAQPYEFITWRAARRRHQAQRALQKRLCPRRLSTIIDNARGDVAVIDILLRHALITLFRVPLSSTAERYRLRAARVRVYASVIRCCRCYGAARLQARVR